VSTNPSPDLSDPRLLFDVCTLASFLRTSIASARLSGRSPTLFDLECLETLQYALDGEYERRYCTRCKERDAAAASAPNAETNGAM